jgi:hypothetical protein
LSEKNEIKWRELLQPAFLICVTVILAAAGGLAVTGRAKVHKDPIPLKKPLTSMDDKAILPYRVVSKGAIANPDVVRALGTDEYIQWVLEDTSEAPGSPVQLCSLFITYYTGTPDAVPHIPDECYLGGGSQTKENRGLDIPVKWLSSENAMIETKVPVRCLVFGGHSANVWEGEDQFVVIYTFKVNGVYSGNRETTRLVLGTSRSRYSYYAKVEWRFFGAGGLNGGRIYPSVEQAQKASEKLMGVVLGEMERSYWPDWGESAKKSE